MTAAKPLTTTCPKCNGRGYVDYSANVDGNRCWRCDATGRVLTKAGKAAKEAAAAALRVPAADVRVGDRIRHADGGREQFFTVTEIRPALNGTRDTGTLEFCPGSLFVLAGGMVQREAR